MPELPDVEALRRWLVRTGLPGKTIVGVRLDWPGAVQSPEPRAFVEAVRGRRIEALERRGKHLLLRLDGLTLAVHLRMTGSLEVAPGDAPVDPKVRNAFLLDSGEELRFRDPRKLGKLWLGADPSPLLARLGPEPLSPELTTELLAERLRRTAPIKPLLLEQDVVAGVGNIYADEALWCAGIHPMRPARDLTAEDVERLLRCLRSVLERATEALEAMMPISGPPSETAKGPRVLLVPRQEGAPCRTCGTPVVRQVIRGRSAFFCPCCQG